MKSSDEYKISDEVLVHRTNNLIYLGTISEIRNKTYLIKFDDGAEEWTDLNQLKKFQSNAIDTFCVVCKKSNNCDTIRICCHCHRGFHIKCIQFQSKSDQQWCCHNCTATKRTELTQLNTKIERKFKIDKTNKFSYDLDALTWDAHHRENIEQIYCYCGKDGKWYLQMLQCVRCQQWFHANCIKCLSSPLYFGDRFVFHFFTLCDSQFQSLCHSIFFYFFFLQILFVRMCQL